MKSDRQTGTTRADEVRKRRLLNSQKRVRQASHSVRYAAETPQVFVRGGIGTPVINRTQSRVRRKVAIPVGKSGAAMVMPALPILNPGWRLLSGLMVFVFGFLVYAFCTSPEFRVAAPTVSGLQRINPADVEAVVGIHNVPIFMVDPQQIQRDLESAFPELINLSVEITLPAQLKISAQERQPVLIWQYGDQTLWVDTEGILFMPRGDAQPLLTVQSEDAPPTIADVASAHPADSGETESNSIPAKQVLDPLVLNAALQLNTLLPADNVLVYSQRNGFGWNDPRGWKVFIGSSLENLEAKLQVYQELVDKLSQQGIQPSMISVEFLHAPFYRLE